MKLIQALRPVRSPRGFTLIELLVTVSVAAVLMAIAVPSFRDMAIRNQLTSYTNDIIASINFARSEAVRRGVPVAICKSNDGETCSGNWDDGWIIFANKNGDSPAVADDPDDEPVLKVYGPVASHFSVGIDASFANDITYGSDGAATATGVIAFCYDDELEGAKAIVVTPLRPRVAKDTDNDRIPNRDDTLNIASCSAPGG